MASKKPKKPQIISVQKDRPSRRVHDDVRLADGSVWHVTAMDAKTMTLERWK